MNKKLVLTVIFFLCLPIALAEIKMSVISYNADTQKARILIANTGTEDYRDLTFAFDDMQPREYKGSLLKAGTAIVMPRIVPPGRHIITVSTKEGAVFSQELLFAPAGEQILQTNVRIKETEPEEKEAVQVSKPEAEETRKEFPVILVVFIILAIAVAVYLKVNPSARQKLAYALSNLKSRITQKISRKVPTQRAQTWQTQRRAYQPPQSRRQSSRTAVATRRTRTFGRFQRGRR